MLLLLRNQNHGINLEVVEGMQFDRGYVSSYGYRYRQNGSRSEEPYTLITDKTQYPEILLLLNRLYNKRKWLLSPKMLKRSTCNPIPNKLRGTFTCRCSTQALAEERNAREVATLTGEKDY